MRLRHVRRQLEQELFRIVDILKQRSCFAKRKEHIQFACAHWYRDCAFDITSKPMAA